MFHVPPAVQFSLLPFWLITRTRYNIDFAREMTLLIVYMLKPISFFPMFSLNCVVRNQHNLERYLFKNVDNKVLTHEYFGF